jgi:molybdopterin converting factor small subunit
MATVRYFAAARAAVGAATETVDAGSVKELVTLLEARHGERLTRILSACSFLVDGLACHEPSTELSAMSTVDVLPPFAGG